MKPRFADLKNTEQKAIEARYHRMTPEDFDRTMATASIQIPTAIRLSKPLVAALKAVAESQGRKEYQAMVRRWIEERLRQESARS